jgi:hypothetical protein
MPPEVFLSGYPAEMRDIAEQLRNVVHEAVPDAIDRARSHRLAPDRPDPATLSRLRH